MQKYKSLYAFGEIITLKWSIKNKQNVFEKYIYAYI